jgi:putative hemolysin
MELINIKELTKVAHLEKLGGENAAKFLMSVFKLDKINEIYSNHYKKPAVDFIENVLNDTRITYILSNHDKLKIPSQGPFIIVANHPYGGLDGMILLHALLKIRPDLKVMGNFLLQRLEPIANHVIAVNPFEEQFGKKQNISGIKQCIGHIESGHPVVIFPAGEVSSYQQNFNGITDKKWNKSIIKLMMNAKVPIVPVYFHGNNSPMFHWLGMIHPILRTVKIPSELLNKKNKTIVMRIGTPVQISEQKMFPDISKFGRYLRAKTYALGTTTDVSNFFKYRTSSHIEEIIQPISRNLLVQDIMNIPKKFELFRYKNFRVFCTPAVFIPNIIYEIARLREITFREIGEGTNSSYDMDEFDLYYQHLFIWNDETKSVIGGYRAGLGKDIISQFGIKGFYTRTLFKMDRRIIPLLINSIELGRSFIIREYQKKPFSLFLLWKGILYFLLNNNEYRYLVGPVSISDNFSIMSQNLIVDFIKQNYFHHNLSNLIKPRKPFIAAHSNSDTDFLNEELSSINQLDSIIRDIEITGNSIPVLLKKYLKIGGKIACFNVDPAFNNSLDGFLFLDLADVPKDIIQNLSKELKIENLNNRFEF